MYSRKATLFPVIEGSVKSGTLSPTLKPSGDTIRPTMKNVAPMIHQLSLLERFINKRVSLIQ